MKKNLLQKYPPAHIHILSDSATQTVSNEGIVSDVKNWWAAGKSEREGKEAVWPNIKEKCVKLNARLDTLTKTVKAMDDSSVLNASLGLLYKNLYNYEKGGYFLDLSAQLDREIKREENLFGPVAKKSLEVLEKISSVVSGAKVDTAKDFEVALKKLKPLPYPTEMVESKYINDSSYFAGVTPTKSNKNFHVAIREPIWSNIKLKGEKETTITKKDLLTIITKLKKRNDLNIKFISGLGEDGYTAVLKAGLTLLELRGKIKDLPWSLSEASGYEKYAFLDMSHRALTDIVLYQLSLNSYATSVAVITLCERFPTQSTKG